MLYYAVVLLLVALLVSFVIFRVVAFAATEIAKVFLVTFVVLSPIDAYVYFARRKIG